MRIESATALAVQTVRAKVRETRDVNVVRWPFLRDERKRRGDSSPRWHVTTTIMRNLPPSTRVRPSVNVIDQPSFKASANDRFQACSRYARCSSSVGLRLSAISGTLVPSDSRLWAAAAPHVIDDAFDLVIRIGAHDFGVILEQLLQDGRCFLARIIREVLRGRFSFMRRVERACLIKPGRYFSSAGTVK